MLKKLCSYLLVFFTLILSLGMATGCVFDPTINVKRDGDNAYIYNGERYIHTEAMDNFFADYHNYTAVGYAYNSIGQKYEVVLSEKNTEETVIMLYGDYYFQLFCYDFYVKESVLFPNSPWEAKYSIISDAYHQKEIEVDFHFKEVLSSTPINMDFSEMEAGWLNCYIENLYPIYTSINAYLSPSNDMYIGSYDFGYYRVMDEEFKAIVMQLCF